MPINYFLFLCLITAQERKFSLNNYNFILCKDDYIFTDNKTVGGNNIDFGGKTQSEAT